MTAKTKAAKDQLDRFKQAARELECDDDPRAFRKVMEKIAKAKPPTKAK
jgi:hypothetical protein